MVRTLTLALACLALGPALGQPTRLRTNRVLQPEYRAADDAIDVIGPSAWVKPHVSFDVKPYEKLLPNCSWQIMATPVSFPTTLPEWSCIYQSSVLRNLTSTRHAKITATFPKQLRYFSIATYDTHGMPLQVITDYQVQPTTGINHFAYKEKHEELKAGEELGTFEIFISLTGKEKGLGKNQLAALRNPTKDDVAKCDADGGCSCVLIFRNYHTDDKYEPFDVPSYTDDIKFQWGGVEAPREFFGNDKDGWTEIPNCSRPTQEFVTHTFSQILRRELTKIHYTLPINAATRNVNNGFVVPADDWEGLFANGDSTYLVAASVFEADPNGPVYLLSKITGRMPMTPTGLLDGPRYVDTPKTWDVRYFGFSTIDLMGGKPTLDAVVDTEIEAFYTKGNKTWEARNFSIITGPTADLAQACGLLNPEESLFMSTATPEYYKDPKGEGDPILPLPTSLAYLQRFALASPNSKEAFQGTQGRSAHITGKDCVAADTPKGQAKATYHPTCYDPEWVAARMGENAPAIQYYLCDMSKPEGQRLVPWGRTFTKPDVAAVPQA